MSRIAACFESLERQGRKALIPYFTAGDQGPELTVPLMHQLVASGADMIELGVPFSDPAAEGPVIQLACERALEHNVSLRDVLSLVEEFRQTNQQTPVILMGYLNPVEVMGYSTFASAAQQAGVDGVLIVDMPPEEGEPAISEFRSASLDLIFLAAPTSTPERLGKIGNASSGFVYYVSLKGVTGAASLDVAQVAAQLEEVRKHVEIPVGVGFGIKDAATAAKISRVADAVVVGSAIVQRIADNQGDTAAILRTVGELIAGMRTAMDKNS
jgi:tryptophan synthase alpha chain